MTTIYTDNAGNKYLGDCRFANHTIEEPNVKFLRSIVDRPIYSQLSGFNGFIEDVKSLVDSQGFTSEILTETATFRLKITTPTDNFKYDLSKTRNPTSTDDRLYISFINQNIGGTSLNARVSPQLKHPWTTSIQLLDGSFPSALVDYACCVGSQSIGMMMWTNDINDFSRSQFYSYPTFIYFGKIKNVNDTLDYFTGDINKQYVSLYSMAESHFSNIITNNTLITNEMFTEPKGINSSSWWNGSELLTINRANYTMECSDGQIPSGAYWISDFHVFMDNEELGYPVIGKLENLLLATGNFPYLTPVKIIDNAIPDNGSKWYLPVSYFAGKTVLMKVHSSMT